MKIHSQKTMILSSADVQGIIAHYGLDLIMDTLISHMEEAIYTFDPKKIDIPARSGFHYDIPKQGLVEWMPLHKIGSQVTIKLVGYHPNNPDTYGFPTILSTLSAYDTKSGHLLGLMDGVLSTALRTGAASAIASRLLAHPNSSTLGLIGCGAQAVTQLHAMSRIFPLKQVLIYDIDPSAMASLEKRCASLDLDLAFVASNIEQIVENADIVCTATSIDVGAGPLFSNLETKAHLHVNAVGSDFPGKVEVPLDLLKQSFICPDFKAQAIIEGECQRLEESDIDADLTKVLQNREDYTFVQQQRSVFDSTGWALEDHVVMDLFLDYASQLGLGQEIEIESIAGDAKNPYYFLEAIAPVTSALK